jgi:hypothetical protein
MDKCFPCFIAFYLFGPTCQGSSYCLLWHQSKDAINDSGGTIQLGPMDGKGERQKINKRQQNWRQNTRRGKKLKHSIMSFV